MGIQIADSRLREMREIAAKQFMEIAAIPRETDLTVAMAAIVGGHLVDTTTLGNDHPGIWVEYRLREPLEDTVRVFVNVITSAVVERKHEDEDSGIRVYAGVGDDLDEDNP